MSRSPQDADLERVEHVAKDSLTSLEGNGRRQGLSYLLSWLPGHW